MKAFIQRPKGSIISCRIFDPAEGKWWTGTAWTATEASAQLTALTEKTLADPGVNSFHAEVDVPAGLWYVIEYVDDSGVVLKTEPAAGSITGTVPESSLLAKVQSLTQDVSGKVTTDEFNQCVAHALKTYSKHRPAQSAVDITGNGTHDYAVSGISGWISEFSRPLKIEYPIGSVPAEYLDDDDFEIYRGPSGEYLRLLSDAPAATASFRVIFTIPRADVTIVSQDTDAVAALGASYACEILASRYLDSSDPTIAADTVNYRSKSAEAAARARDLRKLYKEHLGLKDGDSVPAAAAVVSREIDYPGGADRLTHPRSLRRTR